MAKVIVFFFNLNLGIIQNWKQNWDLGKYQAAMFKAVPITFICIGSLKECWYSEEDRQQMELTEKRIWGSFIVGCIITKYQWASLLEKNKNNLSKLPISV